MSSINSVSIFLGILRFLIMSLMFDLTTRRVLQSGQLSCGSLIDGHVLGLRWNLTWREPPPLLDFGSTRLTEAHDAPMLPRHEQGVHILGQLEHLARSATVCGGTERRARRALSRPDQLRQHPSLGACRPNAWGGRWQPGRYRRRCDSYGIEWRLPESKSGSSTVAARSGVSRIRPTEYSSSACSKTLSTTTATRASSSC